MKLTKDADNKLLFGVCSGLSKYTGVDATLIRIGFIIGSIFTGSILFWVYLGLGIVLPNGNNLGINIEYQEQDYPRGLPDAFIAGENFIKNDSVSKFIFEFYPDEGLWRVDKFPLKLYQ